MTRTLFEPLSDLSSSRLIASIACSANFSRVSEELQVLAKALEQVQKFSTTNRLGQQNFRNDVAMERLRQANERLEIQKREVALAEQKHAETMRRSATASQQLSKEYQSQDGCCGGLIYCGKPHSFGQGLRWQKLLSLGLLQLIFNLFPP